MDVMLISILLFLFISFLMLGMPICFAAGIPATLFLIVNDIPLSLIAQKMAFSLTGFNLVALPAYMLAALIMNESGVTKRIFHFAMDLLGSIPGGLAHANVLASLIFAGMSGSALADVGGLSQVEIKAMQEGGYDIEFSIAVSIASATVGPIFPPSGMFIIYALIAEVSVGAMFIAGIIPGILITLALMIYIAIIAKKRGLPKGKRVSFKELFKSFLQAFPSLVVPLIIIGGIISGIFTVIESAVFAVIYTIFLGVFIYKELSLRGLYNCILNVVYYSSSLMFLVSISLFLGWIFIVSRVPQFVSQYIISSGISPHIMISVILLFFLLLGCIIENQTIIILVVPVFIPGLRAMGIDLIHFGVVMMLMICIGLMTPPMGLSLFLMSSITNVKIEKIIREVLPFLVPLLIITWILAYIPSLTLYLPKLFNLLD